MDKNICIITPAPLGPSETFLQAHIDRIEGNIFHLCGYYNQYQYQGKSLREIYKPKESKWKRLLNLLPYYVVFRRNQNIKNEFNDFNLAKKFLAEKKIDVVLSEYGTTGAFITPVCCSSGIPLIVHFHGLDASHQGTLNEFREKYLEMFSYASKVIAVSQKMMNDLKVMGCTESKLVYNPYGPDPEFFDVTPDYNANHIIAVGRQTYKKAPYLTILAFQKALRQFPELVLDFVGVGELEEVSRNMVRGLGMEKNVVFHGASDKKEIVRLMNHSFMFMQHSVRAASGDSEGTPVAVLEAMAAGLPVIATRHAGIPDIVVEGETGFLTDECDVDGMTDYLVQMAGNRKRAGLMGESGRKHVSENFTMEKHIDTINGLILTI